MLPNKITLLHGRLTTERLSLRCFDFLVHTPCTEQSFYSFSRQLKVLEEAEKPQEQVTVEKVDGILHELEAWLNTQQSSKAASSTEGSMSVQVHLPSQESVVSSFSDLTGTGTGNWNWTWV